MLESAHGWLGPGSSTLSGENKGSTLDLNCKRHCKEFLSLQFR